MRSVLLHSFFFSFLTSFACTCDPIKPIDTDGIEEYNIIFTGKVDSVSATNKGKVHFTISELYKGTEEENIIVTFDDSSACMMSFDMNEEWIIYGNYKQFNELTVSICEHSRKKFEKAENDFYQIAAKRTYEEEKQFLISTLGIQPFVDKTTINRQQEQISRRNIQPDPLNKLWLILVSLVTMGIIYFITRKKREE